MSSSDATAGRCNNMILVVLRETDSLAVNWRPCFAEKLPDAHHCAYKEGIGPYVTDPVWVCESDK